uniref:G_PROTEIN_RECEP_F1_2 domain-containing protein n=1 Tax=Gongylonema pulchrum TaxID=637853 RepID=A0A183E0T0_9BILA
LRNSYRKKLILLLLEILMSLLPVRAFYTMHTVIRMMPKVEILPHMTIRYCFRHELSLFVIAFGLLQKHS